MKTSSLLSSLGALCLLLSLCASTATADDSPDDSAPAPRVMTDAEKAAAAAAVFEAFKAGDAPALLSMTVSDDDMKTQCPLLLEAINAAYGDMLTGAPSPGGQPNTRLVEDLSRYIDTMKPEARLASINNDLNRCRAPLDLSVITVTSFEGAEEAYAKPGLEAFCPASFQPINHFKITLSDGSSLTLDNPVFINGTFKAMGGFSCKLDHRTYGSR
jgi:hypothetical protein